MNARGLANALAVFAALALAGLGALTLSVRTAPPVAAEGHPVRADAVIDATGATVPRGDYRRIASLGLIPDHLLLELVDPRRVVAWSGYSTGRDERRIGDGRRLAGTPSAETLFALEPDLVLLSGAPGDAGLVARLRERGIAVFDAGPAYGFASLAPDLRAMGALVGHPAEAAAWAQRLAARIDRLARTAPAPRFGALALSTFADQLYLGTRAADGRASSYHDVLEAGGLRDLAAGHFADPWPQIGSELLLELAPAIVVTRRGQAERLRRHPAIRRLDPRIIELDPRLWDHPGPPLVTAAEELRRLLGGF